MHNWWSLPEVEGHASSKTVAKALNDRDFRDKSSNEFGRDPSLDTSMTGIRKGVAPQLKSWRRLPYAGQDAVHTVNNIRGDHG